MQYVTLPPLTQTQRVNATVQIQASNMKSGKTVVTEHGLAEWDRRVPTTEWDLDPAVTLPRPTRVAVAAAISTMDGRHINIWRDTITLQDRS